MRQLLWEGKKNPIPAGFLLGLLVVLLFLNWAVAEKEISRLRAGNTEEYYRGQDRAYATVEGTITTANMEWVVSEKNRLDTLILGGGFFHRGRSRTHLYRVCLLRLSPFSKAICRCGVCLQLWCFLGRCGRKSPG